MSMIRTGGKIHPSWVEHLVLVHHQSSSAKSPKKKGKKSK